MADLSDVENAIISLVNQTVYPNGTAQASAIGIPCRIARGWPEPVQIDTDMAAKKAFISVYPLQIEQNVSRFARTWQQLSLPSITLTAAVSDKSVTFSGTVTPPLNVAVVVSGAAYIYAAQTTDTPVSIATALASMIGQSASSNGAVLTIPSALSLASQIGGVGTQIRETKRQKRRIQITLWCPSPSSRDAAASLIDQAMSAVDWLSFPDGSRGRLIYCLSNIDDGDQKVAVWRRTIVYSVEYPTVQTRMVPQIVMGHIVATGGIDTSNPPLFTSDI